MKKEKKQIPFVFVGTPAYDGKVDTDYSQSLAETAFMSATWGIRFSACVMGNGAFIEMNRNIMVQKFLREKDYTHLFFVDSDLKFPYHAFINLVVANHPLSAGVYRRRQEPEDYPANWLPNPDIKGPDGEDTLWVENNDWLQCSRAPTGFMCIRRDVIEKMIEDCQYVNVANQPPLPWLFETKIDEGDRFVGEDFTFCDKYMELYEKGEFDVPIQVIPDVDFVHGGYKGNWAKFLNKKVETYKSERRLGKKKEVA